VAAAPSAAPASSPEDEAALQAERSFVLTAELGYATLHLDFIVFKRSAPWAGVNGQQVVPGSIVDGFLVEEIGADFVRLRDRKGAVVLRVR
jgi:hypothetical protein